MAKQVSGLSEDCSSPTNHSKRRIKACKVLCMIRRSISCGLYLLSVQKSSRMLLWLRLELFREEPSLGDNDDDHSEPRHHLIVESLNTLNKEE
jgi:hypothetical protein